MDTIPWRDVRVGDVLLHEGKGEISKLIKWASDSDYSHAATIFDFGDIAEAISDGVHLHDSLEKRASDTQNFYKVDVIRPAVAMQHPLPAGDVLALQNSASALINAKFALNQMFELGVICVARNKFPKTDDAKFLVWWILNVIVPVDPSRLVCSEFVYLVFANAKTVPSERLAPSIVVKRHAPRPFPAIDWGKLWQEYEEASHHGVDSNFPPKPDMRKVTDEELQAAYARTAILLRVEGGESARRSLLALGPQPLPHPNPAILLPQDLDDSPTFKSVGRLVPE